MIVEAGQAGVAVWRYSGDPRPRYYWWGRRIAAARQIRQAVAEGRVEEVLRGWA